MSFATSRMARALVLLARADVTFLAGCVTARSTCAGERRDFLVIQLLLTGPANAPAFHLQSFPDARQDDCTGSLIRTGRDFDIGSSFSGDPRVVVCAAGHGPIST